MSQSNLEQSHFEWIQRTMCFAISYALISFRFRSVIELFYFTSERLTVYRRARSEPINVLAFKGFLMILPIISLFPCDKILPRSVGLVLGTVKPSEYPLILSRPSAAAVIKTTKISVSVAADNSMTRLLSWSNTLFQ